MITVEHLQKSYGTNIVLADITFTLGTGQRGAIVGYNGVGKTTVLKILSGEVSADAGTFEFLPNAKVGYLRQDTSLVEDVSVIDYLRKTTGIDALEKIMSETNDLSDIENKHRYDEALSRFEHMNGYSFEHKVSAMLAGFGLEDIPLTRSIANLSSGQKCKIALIGILLQENDVLLLDEPTNNLDLASLIWLEDYLSRSASTILMVSHDRRFVDKIATKIIEIDWQQRTCQMMNGTYSDYLAEMSRRRERQHQLYEMQQDEIARLRSRAESIKQKAKSGGKMVDEDKFRQGFMRDKATKSAKGAKAIERRIDQMDKVEKPVNRTALVITTVERQGEGDRSISVNDVIVGYEDTPIAGPISMQIGYGSRIGILGMNGSGKSTLLKTLTGHAKPLAGTIHKGGGVRIGDMLQEHDSLPRDMSPIEYLQERAGIGKSDSFSLLARFGIPANQAKEQIAMISPGGRARILIALFTALEKNVLILDEPTNHLDLEAIEALEEALTTFKGTLIIVSHDRYFIERTRLESLYEISDGRISQIPDLKEYIKKSENKARRLLRAL